MPRAALFDVDGTLTDTTYLHVNAWWEALRQAGHTVPTAALHGAVGLGAGDLLDHVLGTGRDHSRDASISAAHKTLYGTCHERLSALEGARDLLYTLHGRGWRIVLATSAQGSELEALRRALDADAVISGTSSADDVSEGKPAPGPVDQARQLAGAAREQTVFVGDAVWDMRAASRAGVTPLAVLSGGIPRADLEEAGAQQVYANPADLLAGLDGSAFARLEREG
ncbi:MULTISPECIES: HAD family hydrolase [unclassified Streptomyces]|uniref:HAD family hydrolase n=1 Tax=unclassified Streptomyces TaxID=2593676 RepID=UPI002DDA74C1|nr:MULTISPECIES: HAD family hydrolase [unclassified Streptomyces]WSA94137.1 HAD family hydrolase [Streptomyces sp. NBC_01795]WSB78562.1 HAD family hydrolase [Streptomyces sp. NBC_01775]WSS42026.1 HAD family hydrolase [Streptomyces sp. NBC_01187]